ncbi:MAG: AAA family ATPase [Bdellovibrionales bacterium]|nr:AAA family ATPase [Bdellovibrionales bacterium]
MTSSPLLLLAQAQALYPQTKLPLHRPVDLSLNEGEIGILFGENGAGKSSLLDRIVFGKRTYTGHIHVNRQNIAYLPQMTVAEFQIPLRLDELSVWNGTVPTVPSTRLWNSASGGEKQMALLEMVLAHHSGDGVLVLDEPTNHLAPTAKAELEARVLRWLRETSGRAVLIVSHDPDLFSNERTSSFEVLRA